MGITISNTPFEKHAMAKSDETERFIRLPDALNGLVLRVKANPEEAKVDTVKAFRSMHDTLVWQRAWIERLEYGLKEIVEAGGIGSLLAEKILRPKCFNCQVEGENKITLEERQHQRRYRCLECGYEWRLGVRDV